VDAQVLSQLLVDLSLVFFREENFLFFLLLLFPLLLQFFSLDLPKLVEALVRNFFALLTDVVFVLDLPQSHEVFFEILGLFVTFNVLVFYFL
jgi:hypothetical protein